MKHYEALRKNLQTNLNDGLIFLSSNTPTTRNNDVHYEYRQNSDFLYLTGIEWPGYHLLLDPKTKNSHLFIPDEDLKFQIWEGKQLTKAEAKKKFGISYVHTISEFPSTFQKLNKKYKNVYTLNPGKKWLHSNLKPKSVSVRSTSLRKHLDELRIHKTKAEISLMKTANHISGLAHIEAMKATKPGLIEQQIQAVFQAKCLEQGARLQAYLPIFAGGSNAAILHYIYNSEKLKAGDLLLIDAGCEWKGYASDITRTFPINGKFNKKQASIYDIVLQAQKECIKNALINTSMRDLHLFSQQILAEGLKDLGIFTADVSDIIESKAINLFYPHGLGHLLGLDVHDVGGKPNKKAKLRNTRTLAPGFVITVEPGLYFIDAHFRNAKTRKTFKNLVNWKKAESYKSVGGIRIEDNIHILKNGNQNLTNVPKERSEIEKIMKS